MLKTKSLLLAILLFTGFAMLGQYNPSTLNLIVGYQYSKSESVHFIEGETGNLVSKVLTEEPVFHVAIDKDADVYYIQTRHYILKGTISTGVVIDKQRVYENEETVQTVNYDNLIIPSGINNEGVGLWSYNKELVDVQKEMLRATNVFKRAKIATKMNKLVQGPTPYTLYNFNTKSFEDYGSFNAFEKYPFALQSDNSIWFNNVGAGELTLNDRVTNEVIKSFDLKAPIKTNPKYKHLADMGTVPLVIADNLFSLTFYGANPNDPKETLTLLCNNKLRRVVTSFTGSQSAAVVYPLFFTNSDEYVYAKTESTFDEPEPQMPPQPKIGVIGAKKKLKAYQAELDAYSAEFKQWITKAYLPEYINILVYSDREMEGNPMLKIEGAASAQIFDNTNAFVIKKDKLVMYDLNTASEKWSIDL